MNVSSNTSLDKESNCCLNASTALLDLVFICYLIIFDYASCCQGWCGARLEDTSPSSLFVSVSLLWWQFLLTGKKLRFQIISFKNIQLSNFIIRLSSVQASALIKKMKKKLLKVPAKMLPSYFLR